MRYILFANNRLGENVLGWLVERGDPPIALVLHPPEMRRFDADIVDALELEDDRILNGSRLSEPGVRDRVRSLNPDLGLSILFGYIFDPEFIDWFPEGIVNLHTSYLPYNRGPYPNVWSIVDQTPAGVSLHYVDEGVDTGDLIARRRVEKAPVDTGQSLDRKLKQVGLELFKQQWESIKRGEVDSRPQPGDGTAHLREDVEAIDRIDLDQRYTARELLNILRARTYPPHESAYFVEDGRKVFVRVDLEYAGEDSDQLP